MPYPPLLEHKALGIKALDATKMHELRVYAKKSQAQLPQTAPQQSFDTLRKDFPTVKTLDDVFKSGLRLNPKGNCLGHRPVYYDYETKSMQAKDYVWQSYEQVEVRIKNFAWGLQKLVKDFGQTGINSMLESTQLKYVITDYACHRFSNTLVALYDTLGADTSEFILNHAEIPVLITTLDKIPNIIALAPKCKYLKSVIIMDGNLHKTPEVKVTMGMGKQALAANGVQLHYFSEVEALGVKNQTAFRLPTPEDVAVISYTSGTTGTPKGAMVTHGNIVSYIRSHYDVGAAPFTTSDVHMCYLPLAHIYEKGNLSTIVVHGGAVGFFRGDTALLLDDIGKLRPTLFASVPRLLNRIYERIIAGAMSGSSLKQALFNRAVEAKLANLKATGSFTHSIWDRLIFSKVSGVLGGRVRLVTSGSAPIASDVLNFLRIAFCCPVVEGYGATETASGGGISFMGDMDPGHIGAPLTCNEVKLASVPEMRYNASDKPFPRGEIWLRGNNIFKGYYKDEEKTKETITEDGWLKTGDIGFIDQKGRIHIIDRKKNIFKLAQGEYVAPEKIENVYQKSNLAAQVYVHGDSLQAELVAIVVPDAEYAIPLAREHGVLPADTPNPGPTAPNAPPHPLLKTVCQSQKIRDLVLKDLNKIGKQHGLKGFEFAKAVHLDAEGFSIENGLLTPTFKLKRNEAGLKFRPQIDVMYKALNEAAAAKGAKL
ncbi:acetyl-CoA synthetase-like protein [Rhizoclosmatium globosum]|uniref:Long-chain-fatty-acid--CoA ligase n=1 Tax=Rhizoclosmatium globosum TaxID=329046 RepID=A0A1Y2CN55_9FUNG|nr:acetyl-CoA synthetase-like protein [Rhizoclosmatium globosum]|eukprot:ORY48442.1 acetyl-CoA synthetase-like protein [Rhizoclosmatium globosum]